VDVVLTKREDVLGFIITAWV